MDSNHRQLARDRTRWASRVTAALLSIGLIGPLFGAEPDLITERDKLIRELPLLLETLATDPDPVAMRKWEKWVAGSIRKAEIEGQLATITEVVADVGFIGHFATVMIGGQPHANRIVMAVLRNQQHPGDWRDVRVATLQEFATKLELADACEDAQKQRKELFRIQFGRFGERDWRSVDARLDLEDVTARIKLNENQRDNLQGALLDARKAQLFYVAGQPGEAVKIEKKRLSVISDVIGATNRDYATGQNNLSVYLAAAGAYPESITAAEKAVALMKRIVGERHPNYAHNLNALASLNHRRGDYAAALGQFQVAKNITADTLTEANVQFGVIASNLGGLFLDTGDYAAARTELQTAVDCLSKTEGGDRRYYVGALSNLGGALHQLGEYTEAMKAYRKALAEYERPTEPKRSAPPQLLSNLAALHVELDDTDTALKLYQDAEDVLKTGNRLDYAQLLGNRGMLHQRLAKRSGRQEDYNQAEDLYRRALTIRQAEADKGGIRKDHPLLGRSYTHLATLHSEMGRFKEAEEEFRKAIDLIVKSLGKGHLFVADATNNLGWVHLKNGNAEEALATFEKAARMYQALFSDRHAWYLRAWENSALALRLLGRGAESLKRHREVLERSSAVRDATFVTLSKRQRLEFLEARRATLDLYLSAAVDAGLSAEELYPLVVRCKGYFTAREEAERLGREHPDAKPAIERYLLTCAAIKKLTDSFAGQVQPDLSMRLRDLEEEKEQVERDLATRYEGFFQDPKPDVAKTIAGLLSAKGAFVDYLQYTHVEARVEKDTFLKSEPRLLAVVIRPGTAPVLVHLGPLGRVSAAATHWRKAVGEGVVPQSGDELADLIWRPVQRHLDGIKVVIVSPDGPVCGVPLAALPGARVDSVLLEEFAFGYVMSARHWLERSLGKRQQPVAPAGALVVGRLQYGVPEMGRARFAEIPADADELDSVVDRLRRQGSGGNVVLLTSPDATVERFRREFGPGGDRQRFRYLHLETHGFWDPVGTTRLPQVSERLESVHAINPNALARSPEFRIGLAFHLANTSPDNVLTGEEVAALDLRGVDLAVLAACQSASGDTVPNEGSLSLQRAFHSGGAKTLVAGAWPVPVRETRALMAEFYRHLAVLGADRKLEAMRNAQLALRRGSGRSPAAGPLPPLYWAAWVVSGDPGEIAALQDPGEPAPREPSEAPVIGGPGSSLLWVLLGAGALGAVGGVYWLVRRGVKA